MGQKWATAARFCRNPRPPIGANEEGRNNHDLVDLVPWACSRMLAALPGCVLRFEARREQNGLPAVTIRDLLKATVRHRPDRIVVGEIRGGEAFDLLQFLNTGHSGTVFTVHANSAAQDISRFTTCVLQKRRRNALRNDQEQYRRFAERDCRDRAHTPLPN